MKAKARRAVEILDFPPNVLPGSYKFELFGSSEALVSSCRGIIRYSTDEITLKVAGGRMKISGRGLVMRSCNGRSLRISGEILSVVTPEGINGEDGRRQ